MKVFFVRYSRRRQLCGVRTDRGERYPRCPKEMRLSRQRPIVTVAVSTSILNLSNLISGLSSLSFILHSSNPISFPRRIYTSSCPP